MKIFMTLMFFGVGCCLSSVGRANDAEARMFYEKGSKLFHQEKYSEAAKMFRAAHELKPSWKIRFNIGQSEAAAKRYGFALAQFEAFLVEAGDELSAEREKMVTDEISRLKAKVGGIWVIAPDNSVVWIDGEERGTSPLPGKILVNARVVHHVQIKLDNKILLEREVRVGGQETVEINANKPTGEPLVGATAHGTETTADNADPVEKSNLGGDFASAQEADNTATKASRDESTDSMDTATDQRNKLAIVGWTFLGVGAAALIGGSITGAMAISKNNELKDVCDEDTGICDFQYQEDGAAVTRLGTISTILFPAGAGLAATGIILLIVNKKKRESSVAVRPVMNHMFAGVMMEGTF